jgi:hypothetical protein
MIYNVREQVIMVEKLTDISFEGAKTPEEIEKVVQDNLGISFAECGQVLSQSLLERAEELVGELLNIAPYGDYAKVTEDPEQILSFLKEEAVKPENWKISWIDIKGELMELMFDNQAVDDGDILKGFVFIGLSGKIRHAFAQVHA